MSFTTPASEHLSKAKDYTILKLISLAILLFGGILTQHSS